MSSLILASASPRRAQLLRSAGVRFVVCTSHTTELEAEHLTPFETAQVNAYRKAYAVAKSHPDSTVLGADTVVHLDEQFFGKPTSMRDAERMLGVLQGRAHLVVTGVCLLHGRSRRRHTFAVSTSVTFRKLSLEAIRDYLSRVNPLDKAGGAPA